MTGVVVYAPDEAAAGPTLMVMVRGGEDARANRW